MSDPQAGAGLLETNPSADDPLAPLLGQRVVVLDGGLATQLEAQGNDLAHPLWSARLLLENPSEIVRAHLAFFRAGAVIATTASYQATFQGYAALGIDHAAALALLRKSVTLASDARAAWRADRRRDDTGPLFVAASIGPYGASIANGAEYAGRYGRTVAELGAFHRERLEVLVATEADLLACETIPEIEEGMALVELLEATPGARGWLSFSCADGARLRGGAPAEEAFELAEQSSRVLAVGVNCTAPQHVDELILRARSVTTKPLVVYPNSGEEWDAVGRRWVGGRRPTVDAAAARRWIEAGATIVGGCCRVSPGQIAAVAAMASQMERHTGPADIHATGRELAGIDGVGVDHAETSGRVDG
jgi:homocysteine S-methyltransferase